MDITAILEQGSFLAEFTIPVNVQVPSKIGRISSAEVKLTSAAEVPV